MTDTNAGPGADFCTTAAQSLRSFDRLPAALRDALNYTVLSIAPESIERELGAGWTVQQMVDRINRYRSEVTT